VKEVDQEDANEQLTEAKLLQALDHPHIVRCVDVFTYENSAQTVLCIVQDYCDKGDLKTHIDMQRSQSVGIRESRIRKWVIELLMALDHIH
jgi:NIMA (never in mitosis gene a)-related kinase